MVKTTEHLACFMYTVPSLYEGTTVGQIPQV